MLFYETSEWQDVINGRLYPWLIKRSIAHAIPCCPVSKSLRIPEDLGFFSAVGIGNISTTAEERGGFRGEGAEKVQTRTFAFRHDQGALHLLQLKLNF